MEILSSTERLKLLEYMTVLKYQLAEWMIVEVRITDHRNPDVTSRSIAEILHKLFNATEGRILAFNSIEILMLIRWGRDGDPLKLAKEVKNHLPIGICEAAVMPPTQEGLKKLVLSIAPPTAEDGVLYLARIKRKENIILVADDDMYMRSLAKAGLKGVATIIEIGEGSQIVAAYEKHNPDMVLLDIHMPDLNGQEVLERIQKVDPKAYVIMLSADSSTENVQWTRGHGAKGFLAKPFNKIKLMEYVEACPTLV